jgi:hypothetical protein
VFEEWHLATAAGPGARRPADLPAIRDILTTREAPEARPEKG